MATAEITGGRLKLTGDGFGYAAAKRQLPTTPVGAKRMQFFFRAFMENVSADLDESGENWDNTFCLGLSWDGVFPTYNAGGAGSREAQNFYGLLNNTLNAPSGSPVQTRNVLNHWTDGTSGNEWCAFTEDTAPASVSQAMMFNDGRSLVGNPEPTATFMGTPTETETATDGYALGLLPANATDGALISYMWDIWQNPDDSIEFKHLVTADGIADNSLENTETATAIHTTTGTIDDTTATQWLSGVDIVFPDWILFRWPMKTHSFHVEHYKVRYWEYSS